MSIYLLVVVDDMSIYLLVVVDVYLHVYLSSGGGG